MKTLKVFISSLDKAAILERLRTNTLASKIEFLYTPFGKHYFSGQVGNEKIRIRNALRGASFWSRTPKLSPILHIKLNQKDHHTEIVVCDDTDFEVSGNKQMILAITFCMAITVLLVFGILSFIKPNEVSIWWTLFASAVIASVGLFNSWQLTFSFDTCTRADLEFLQKILTSQS